MIKCMDLTIHSEMIFFKSMLLHTAFTFISMYDLYKVIDKTHKLRFTFKKTTVLVKKIIHPSLVQHCITEYSVMSSV